MAQWIGICGVRLAPLAHALKQFILGHPVVHAEETPVALLAPGRGKTKKAYVWVYRTTNFVAQRAVLLDFCASQGGEHPQRVLQDFSGTLVTDDHSGYHKLQRQGAITAALCMAHTRRKLFEAHQLNGSEIAAHALALIARLYEVQREAREMEPAGRLLLRQSRATAKAIDYSLSKWRALTRYLDDGDVPIDNNAVENSIRPMAIGRRNGLFVSSQQAGERAAMMLSLIESAKLIGHDPWAYLKDVFEPPADAERSRPRLAAAAQLEACRQNRSADCASRDRRTGEEVFW